MSDKLIDHILIAVSKEEFYQFAKKVVEFKKELTDITKISVGDSLGYFGTLKVRDGQEVVIVAEEHEDQTLEELLNQKPASGNQQ